MPFFRDRSDAGQRLAGRLRHLAGKNSIVLALPRGGVAVAYEIARELRAPLDVLNVRKLGVPWHEELAMGAIATGGVRVLNTNLMVSLGITGAELAEVTALQRLELDRRERAFRGEKPPIDVQGRIVVLVDDGIATGATARTAIMVLRSMHPQKIVLAVPVVQASVATELAREVDEIACEAAPEDLGAIGVWYDDFHQLSDENVRAILARATAEVYASSRAPVRSENTDNLSVKAG